MPHLLEGEHLVHIYRRHWIRFVWHLAVPVIILVLVLVIESVTGILFKGDTPVIVVVLALALVGLWAIEGWVRWNAESLTLTDKRVILEEGIFSRSTKVIALDRITDVGTHQSVLGYMFHYGTVNIHTGSSEAETFRFVPLPDSVRDQVFVQSGHMGAAPPPPMPMDAAVAEPEREAPLPRREDVEEALRDLLAGRVNREAVAAWARNFQGVEEGMFDSPATSEALNNLAEADERAPDHTYIHDPIDFQIWLGRLQEEQAQR
ncbi:MAG: PH domain-containing protein [Candidatus Dormibacteraeota bacterium]|nr:PH domain-containing protein [Candidatus Dormibacteraeota bacterium]